MFLARWQHDLHITLAVLREPGSVRALLEALAAPRPLALALMLAMVLLAGTFQWLLPRFQEALALNAQLRDKQSLGRNEQQTLRRLAQLQAQMKAVPMRVRELGPGESPAMAALAMAQQTMALAKQLSSGDTLPKPLRQCKALSLTARGRTRIQAPSPEVGWPSVQLTRYQYELALRGPYPALSAFINRLALAPQLVGVDRVDIQRLPLGRRALPDILSRPDYPVPLEMVVSLSFYLADTSAQPAAAAR